MVYSLYPPPTCTPLTIPPHYTIFAFRNPKCKTTKLTENTNKIKLYDLGCEALKKGGYKLTPTRTSVLRVLTDSNAPQSIQTLVETIGDSSVDQSTIYRTLETFLKISLIETLFSQVLSLKQL